jgi:hypothetical protein
MEPKMLYDVQMLVCAQLFKDLFPMGLKKGFVWMTACEEYDEDAPDRLIDERGKQDNGQIIRALRQPAVLGRVAGTCKTLRAEVKKYRTAKLLDAVENMNTYPRPMALYLSECAVPAATCMRFTVRLGKRDMYEVAFVRRDKEQAADDGVPQELFAQSVIQTHDGKPAWTSLERRFAFHKLCFVNFWGLKPDEKEQYRLWHKQTGETMNLWLELQRNIFKLRLR